jgi:hypothetical protein
MAADPAPQPAALARVHQAWAVVAQFDREPGPFLLRAAQAVAEFTRAGDVREVAMQQIQLAVARMEAGELVGAQQLVAESVASMDGLGIQGITAIGRGLLGHLTALAGDVDLGREITERSLSQHLAHGDRRNEAGTLLYLALIELLAEAPAAAVDVALRAARCAERRRPSLHAYALAVIGDATRRAGNASEAVSHTQRAIDLCAVQPTESGSAFIALAHAEALHAAGRTEEARAVVIDARTRLEAQAGQLEDGAKQAAFLRRVSVHARTLALAGEWR